MLSSRAQDIKVHAGTVYLDQAGDAYKVDTTVTHSGYDGYKLINDVGILHLASPIKFNANVQPIALQTGNADLAGLPCNLTGWGTLQVTLNLSDIIKQTT